MRPPALLVPTSLAALLALTGASRGEPPAAAQPLYDPSTVTTVQGQIVRIERVPAGSREGVHLRLSTGTEDVDVHLGPARFVDAQPLKLRTGEVVEVTGSRLLVERKPTLLAREVRRDGERMTLRDASGVPAWSRRR